MFLAISLHIGLQFAGIDLEYFGSLYKLLKMQINQFYLL